MAEQIGCKDCPSPDCRGCNIYILATMLKLGRFDSLMNGNRTIDMKRSGDGEWTDRLFLKSEIIHHARCSSCGKMCGVCIDGKNIDARFCPNCGARMRMSDD